MRRFLLTLILLLAGCASWNVHLSHDTEYLQSYSTAILSIPSGMDNTLPMGNDYPVPKDETAIPEKPVSLLPPGSLAARLAK